MPISRIKTDGIQDNAVTLAKTDSLFVNTEISGTEAAKMPVGTTAQRTSAQSGDIRFNTTISLMEYYDGTRWKSIDAPPSISSVVYSNGATAADTDGGETITLNGDNFSTTGAVDVEVNGNSASSVSVVSSTQLTFVSPSGSSGDVQVEVINPSGLSGRSAFSYSGTPDWNTSADSILLDAAQGSSVNITSVTASEGADTITYTEVTSVLTGNGANEMNLTLNSSTGAITGTLPSVSSDTTFTFTLRAEDDEGQITDRQFKIRVTTNYFGDGSDGAFSS